MVDVGKRTFHYVLLIVAVAGKGLLLCVCTVSS